MIIIIDGYNVLKNVLRGEEASSEEREQFLRSLGSYARIKKHQIVVVFDGGMYGWSSDEKVHGIRVLYSGARESADDRIRKLLREWKNHDTLLVSSDRELVHNASRADILCIKAEEFYRLLLQAVEKGDAIQPHGTHGVIKMTNGGDSELDMLMQEGSESVSVKADDLKADTSSRQSPSKRVSRAERRLQEMLKKL